MREELVQREYGAPVTEVIRIQRVPELVVERPREHPDEPRLGHGRAA